MLEFDDIKKAYDNIRNSIKKTPLVECATLNELTQSKVLLKLENLQKTGSFKVRGALNKIINLTDSEKKAGVIASSAGNHAQGVALGAKEAKIKATIVMPETAPISKVVSTKNYGARIVQYGSIYDHAYQKALEIQKEERQVFLHPFDDEYVIAGQGTIGLEILNEYKDIDMIFVPVGGGGILSGIALAVKSINPNIKVIGVEAENASSMKKALEVGKPIFIDDCKTIADGIAVAKVGDITYELVKKYVDEIITVSDDDIAQALLFLLEKAKVVAEGAGATSLAGLMSLKIDIKGKTACCVISGGNIDVNNIEKIVNKAQILQARRVRFVVYLSDTVGQINKLTKILMNNYANILYLNQTRYNIDLNITEQELSVVIECKNREHGEHILNELEKEGFKIKRK